MRMRLFVIMVALLALVSGFASAQDIYYKGALNVELSNASLSAGETLKGTFTVYDFGPYAFNDAYVVAELVSGPSANLGYPSQNSNSGIVFLEKKFEARVMPMEQRHIPFGITLPASLGAGTYTLDAYYRNGRAPISGIAHLFNSPQSTEFTVTGSGNFPAINIVRTKTVFNNQVGPVGPPAQPGSTIRGSVYVDNNSGTDAANYTVWAGLCEWDDTLCSAFLSEDSKQVNLKAGSETEAELSLKAPEMPGAYAIRIEVRDQKGSMVSLYRNRSIVVGGTAKIRKLDINPQKIEAGKQETITVLLGPSPDHYTYPDFSNFTVSAWVENGGTKVYEKTINVADMNSETELREFSVPFTPEQSTDTYKVCASVDRSGVQYDLYCYDVSPIPEEKMAPRGRIEVKTGYENSSGRFSLQACGFDGNGSPETMEAHLSFVDTRGYSLVKDEDISGKQCYTESFRIDEARYILAVDDLRDNTQYNKELDFSAPAPKQCVTLGGTFCSAGQSCTGYIAGSAEGSCCVGSCVPTQNSIAGSGPTETAPQQPPSLFMPIVLAALGVLVLLAVLAMTRKGQGNESTGVEESENQ